MKKKLQAGLNQITSFFSKVKAWSLTKPILLGLAVGLGLIIVAYHFAYRGRIYPGITAAGQPIGNRTLEEAKEKIDQWTANLAKIKLTFSADGQKWEFDLAEIEFHYDGLATARKAYQIGRDRNLIQNFKTKTQTWFQGTDLELEYDLNRELLQNQVATIASQILIPVINPQVKIVDQKIEVEQGQAGRELDEAQLFASLHSRLAQYDLRPIKLPIIHLSPFLTEEELIRVKERAEKFIGQKLIFVFGDDRWELEDQTLVGFLSFQKGFDETKITSQTANLASVIDRPPQNATFQFEQGKVTQFRPALEGRRLDQEETKKLIQEALVQIEKEEKLEPITLTVSVALPTITIDQVNNLGIEKLLGRGISYFWGSIRSRIHNLTLASSNLNGVLIPPGETFSFNQTLGEVSPATGYQSAFVIKEGKTILDDGGGVCQVSTTLFRAALNSGLPILERHPHSYRVSYYEQGGFGPGLDATVWIPSVDLKFKNDTPGHLLIQAKTDQTNGLLTFELYGTDDGRKVSLSSPRVWDQTPPPPDLYQDDPTLPAGTVKRIEHAIWGAKASVRWQVTRGEEVLQDRTFYSVYQPWQAIYLRGTGL